MIYVYDLLVNLNEELIDFYDWEDTDDMFHVRKCLLIKVLSKDYYNMLTNKIKISDSFMKEIKGKAQIFSGRNTIIIDYMIAVTDGINAFIIKFDNNGVSKLKSKFIINEEVEIINLSSSMKVSNIDFDIINKENINKMTRKEKRIVNLILYQLENIKNNKDMIDYLYYEWFDTNNGDNKLDKLISNIRESYSNKHIEFLNILNLITNK